MLSKLAKLLCNLTLLNDRNWCYGNCTYFCFMWSFVSRVASQTHTWGTNLTRLVTFLTHQEASAQLSEATWFCEVLGDWGLSQGQRDCAEFAQRLLHWLRVDFFDQRWERRLQHAATIEIMDQGDTCTPITLQITLDMHHKGFCHFHDLISHWSQEHSMTKALLEARQCLCLQVDRFVRADDGTILTSPCLIDLDTEVNFPTFCTQGLRAEMVSFVPIAGTAHLGQDRAGHFRSILKVRPGLTETQQPVAWLVTEDGQAPVPTWRPPQWFSAHVSVIWMIRTDCLYMQQYQPDLLAHDRSDLWSMTRAPLADSSGSLPTPETMGEGREPLSSEADDCGPADDTPAPPLPANELLTFLQGRSDVTAAYDE